MIIDKQCPVCGRLMLQRTNSENGSEFLGCSGWPEFCKHTEPLPEEIKMKKLGHPMLPGFDKEKDE